ncbi:MAG: UbiA-like polyprenyltransferase [Candidatus Methylacidiphilales bacterium]
MAALRDMHGFWVRFGKFIRISHTVFALPFALTSAAVAARGWPSLRVMVLIVGCMLTARTAAMLFNRVVDWDIDQQNPRTMDRHRLMHRSTASWLCGISCILFMATAWWINPLCGWLSPVALAMILGYSLTKRFTVWCHGFLGLALAAAPMGAWAAVTGELWSFEPYLLAAGVWLWVSGFDMIYAVLDTEADRKLGLFSVPSRLGPQAARRLALGLHAMAWILFGLFGWKAELGGPWGAYAICWWLCLPLLWVEHRWARQDDPVVLNRAFFHINAAVSVLILLGTVLELTSDI